MRTVLLLITSALLGLAAPAYAQAPATPPARVDVARVVRTCLDGASAMGPTVGAARGIIERALQDGAPCGVQIPLPADTAQRPTAGQVTTIAVTDVLAAVDADMQTANCAQAAQTPVCEALATVRTRAIGLKRGFDTMVAGGNPGLEQDAFEIQAELQGYGGNQPFSFLRRALMRGAPAVAAKIADGQRLTTTAGGVPVDILANDEQTPCTGCDADARALLPAIAYARILTAAYDAGYLRYLWTDVAASERARRDRWTAYHFGAGEQRVQLPWELAVNGWMYERQSRREERELVERARAEGRDPPPPPPREPPTSALIIAHPSVGLTLKDRDGADSSIVGVVEVAGYSWWDYNENKREGEWGVSAIAAYQPSEEADDWGYGVLVRTPYRNINIAWVTTQRDDGGSDDAFLISVDVSNLLSGLGTQSRTCRMGVGACENAE